MPPPSTPATGRLRRGPPCGVRAAFASALLACALLSAAVLTGCRTAPTQIPERPFEGRLSGSAFDADIALLASPDFVLRSQAAQRLVAAGPAGLTALGAAGDRPTPGPGTSAESTTGPVLVAILGQVAEAEVEALIASPQPALRAAAAREAGRRGAWGPVPALIERLTDQEPVVRESAHAALRRITGELVEPGGPGLAGAGRAERWRQWWRLEGRARSERDVPGPARSGS